MALLRKIPLDQVDGFPFLERVDFETLTMRLAGRELTRPETAPDADGDVHSKAFFHHLVGIQPQLERLEMILSSSQASNAWITGAKGIGKTALVEALLRNRAEKRLTSALMSRPYYIFDPNSFAVDAHSGDAAKKFDECLAKASEGGGVLIIDHIDDFFKTAGPELASVLASTLVNHLERNSDFQAIIVSDSDRNANILASSGGIARQFQKLDLQKEADDDELRKILVAKFSTLEKTHNVRFSGEAADEIIRLLARYPGKAFEGARPQNAIKFADKVATHVHLNRYAEPAEVTELRERIRLLQDELAITPPSNDQTAELQRGIADMSATYARLDAAWRTKFEPLLKARAAFDSLNTKLDILRNKKDRTPVEEQQLNIYARSYGEAKARVEKEEKALYPEPPLVEPKHVQLVFSQESGVPTSTLSEDKLEHLAKLDEYLDAEVVHQTEPKAAVATAYFQRETGISDPSRPAGVYLFLGGTGLGKTELAKVLARFDMGEGAEPIIVRLSEFKGKEAGKRLTGADPGLVGYEDGSCLEGVRKNPRAIILLDEADKADPSVFDVLMQVLEEGKLTPSNSKTPIEFKDTIVILASNALRAGDFKKEELHDEAVVREKLANVVNPETGTPQFKREFIGRIDRVFVFEDLDPSDHVMIFRKEIRKLNRDYKGRGIAVEVPDETAEAIIRLYNDPTVGGRLSRNISKKYIRPLITDYLKAHIKEVMNEDAKFSAWLRVELDGTQLRLRPLAQPQAPGMRTAPKKILATSPL